jgi:phosphatidylinositol dimannoside acyltransferase
MVSTALNASAASVLSRLKLELRADSVLWRRALHAGIQAAPEPWLRYSPPLFGLAFGAALGPERRAVRAALRRVLGPRPLAHELYDVARVFANYAWSLTDALLVGADRGFVATSRPVADWHFLGSLARGRGVIMATAQTAGWDVSGVCIHDRKLGHDVWILMAPEPNAAAREVSDDHRRRAGVRIVHVGDDPLASLPILRHLRNGGVVALKFDRVHGGMRTREVTICGERWRIPEGPLSLAALTGAPIVTSFTRRLGFLEYEIVNYPPIELPRRPSEDELQSAAQRMASYFESFVRAHPTQWFRFHEL